MNCLIVDDKEIPRTIIKRLLELDEELVLVGECHDAVEAYQKIKTLQIDLIFLDIHMPGMNGIELAKILEDKKNLEDKSPLIIFITSLAEYAVDAFDLDVVDFLVKPIVPARFLQAVEKAKRIFQKSQITISHQSSEFSFIRDSNVVRRLKIDDILYFEAIGDYVKIYLVKQNYSIHSSLKTIEQKLPKHLFLRVHRSYIINLSKVDSIEGRTLIINSNMVPVSDAYKSELNKRMNFL